MALTIKQCTNAKPGRLSDGGGLYLLTKPAPSAKTGKPAKSRGSQSWVLRVQVQDNRRDIGLGSFTAEAIPVDVPLERRSRLTLEQARKKAQLWREMVKAGIDPRVALTPKEEPKVVTFRSAAEDCHKHHKGGWKNAKHKTEWLSSLERYVFKDLGDMPVSDVDAAAIQRALMQKVPIPDGKEEAFWLAKPDTSRRVMQRTLATLDYAKAKKWRDVAAPTGELKYLLARQPKDDSHFAAMDWKDVPAFMTTLRASEQSVGRLALQFLILTAARAGEVRGATWKEIDFEAAEWRIPKERMKAGKEHVVPLVPAAIAILKELEGISVDWVFPGLKGNAMSDATMNKSLRLAGGEGLTVHGFRSSFRDWAAENGFADSWCEAALAHADTNAVQAAYRRTSFLDQRRDKLMPAWASFVSGDRSNVITLVGTGR